MKEHETGGPSGPALLLRFLRDTLVAQLLPLVFAGVFMLAVAGLTTTVAWLMEPAFNAIFRSSDPDRLYLVALAFPAVLTARGVANYIARLLLNRVGLDVVATSQKRLFDHLQGMDIFFIARYRTAGLTNRIVGDTASLRSVLIDLMRLLSSDLPLIAGLVASLFVFDLDLALLALVVVPLAAIPVVLLGRAARVVGNRTLVERGLFAGAMLQALQSMRLVKIYGAEEFERKRAFDRSDALYRLSMRSVLIEGILAVSLDLIIGVVFSVIAVYGFYRLSNGTLDPGTLVAFVTAAYLAYRPMKGLGKGMVSAQSLFAVLRRYYAFLDTAPGIPDAPGARPLQVSQGEIRLENVTLHYPGRDEPALDGLDLTLPGGKTTALVGRSGAGKSSVFSLLVRFVDPDGGRILIDGQDIREVPQSSLWRTVTLVPQEAVILDDTIRANIAFGVEDAADAEIERAARNAALEDVVRSLPEGYATLVGEDGVRLSGGQRQRLSIARAMLRETPVLLLDEATSALDPENERTVREAFDRVRQGRTCVVIAHRLSTVRNADRICVMDAGRVVASGTHEELLASCPLYVSLCEQDGGVTDAT
nr:ABC transporter ATP-binding protein [Phaeovibrio sulfidiphilus]